ncbi:MAG: hypothetical protein A2V63_03555 [Candidatus Eisenbacteria bacterium RBG_19FT_COMBO_70_11]|nr:MAG: hypothetical protein A2V63_03555 [Candidatus Eisenbacteria bacterium RBG_19FT_COMBO_70_11]
MIEYSEHPLASEMETRWDAFVLDAPHGSLFQSGLWSRSTGGARFGRLWAEEGGEIVLAMLLERLRPVPIAGSRGLALRGPVVAELGALERHLPAILDTLRRRGYGAITLNPYWPGADAERVRSLLGALGFEIVQTPGSIHDCSVQVDLAQDLDAIKSSFRATTRHEIDRAAKRGIRCEVVTAKPDYEALLLIMQRMFRAKGLPAPDARMMHALWDTVFAPGRFGRVIVTKDEQGDAPLGGIVLLVHGERCVYTWGATDPERRAGQYAGQLAHWQGMAWAKARGCACYDMGGYREDAPPESPMDKINRFKQGFSKQVVRFVPLHRRYLRPWSRPVLRAVETWIVPHVRALRADH